MSIYVEIKIKRKIWSWYEDLPNLCSRSKCVRKIQST